MWRAILAVVIALALPTQAAAGPVAEAAGRAARELGTATAQRERPGRGGRFWTGVALLAGGATLAALSGFEIGDDEPGPDDGEDFDDSDDGEDSDGWGEKAIVGGGVAAAAIGGLLLITGRDSRPSITLRPGRLTVRQTVRF